MDMRTIFNAYPISTWQLMVEQGVGFYIPSYQREYSWDSSNIDRLFEDFGHGLQMLHMSDQKDAVTFIGAMIVIHDVRHETVEPSVKGQLPGKVLVLIDGQQRLSTILMLHAILHEQLSVMLNQLVRLDSNGLEATQWLANQTMVARENLRMTYEQDMIHGDQEFRWYPRIIRAYDDSWSRDARRASYSSPIAAFLHGYAKFARSDGSHEYIHSAPPYGDRERHNKIFHNCNAIREWIKKLAKGQADIEIPSLELIARDQDFQDSLLSERLPQDVKERLTNAPGDSTGSIFPELMRLLIFTQYLIQRVAVTLVTANNEDYAFDMFEALNTTGTPLTAFETFRPRVISAEHLVGYERSPSRRYMKSIEEFLEIFTDADKKQRATDRLLVPFALAESGFKLSKRLREQRGYLKLRYEELTTIEEKRRFVEHMAHSSVFIKDYWPESIEEPSKISELSLQDKDLSTLCLEVLRLSKHDITIGPLIRFFAQIQLTSGREQEQAVQEFESAIKAMTAFWVIWRSVRRTTGGIDSRYRDLMEKGDIRQGIRPFSRRTVLMNQSGRAYEYSPKPNSNNLIEVLRENLASRTPRIQSKTDWVQYAKEMPFYDTTIPTAITRLILLAANSDTVISASQPGLVEPARPGTMPLLRIEQWRDFATIEHIAPVDTGAHGWNVDLYEDPDLIHQIGNLTLLPQIENSVIGNKPWVHKRAFYGILAARTQTDIDAKLADARSVGLNVRIATQKLLEVSRWLPHVEAISKLDGDWSTGFVKRRSEQILDLAWNRIAPWLGL